MIGDLNKFDTELKKISSWNLTYSQKVTIIYPLNLKELKNIINILKKEKRFFAIRTGECSYDSKSIVSGKNNFLISLKKFNKKIKVNSKQNMISVSSGTKISDIILLLKEKKLTLYSVPGGEHISVGGAISANAIGKDSSKKMSSFGDSVNYLKVITHSGKVKELKNNSRELRNYIGSFGFFGIILEAKIKVKKILSSNLLLETKILENISQIENELMKNDEYKYVQVDPFFRSKNFAIIFKTNYVKNIKNNFKYINLEPSFIEKLIFKFSSFFINRVTWRIFYKVFFILNKNKKKIIDLHNFHYASKYKHMVPLICRGGLVDYEILIKKKFSSYFYLIQKFLVENDLAPIYIVIKKLFKSKNDFFYSFSDNAYSVAISFNLKNLDYKKKIALENFLSKNNLMINLAKTDTRFISKNKLKLKDKKIFMSLYKKMLLNK